jgi:NAD(P)H-flavin reductase
MNFSNNKYFPFKKIHETVTIYTVTWNLYGKTASLTELIKLIPKNEFHHIYAIGTEECMRSILMSMIYANKSPWEKLVQ